MSNRASLCVTSAIFLISLGGYLFFSPAHFLTSPDEELNLRTALSFLQGHGGAIPALEGFASKTSKTGREYAQYGLGLPLASLPWCALGTAIDPTPNKLELNTLDRFFSGRDTLESVGTGFLRGWMTVFTMMVSALTAVLVFSLVHYMGTSLLNSLFITFLLVFGCYTWPHGRTFFTEPLTAFCLIAAVWCFVKNRMNPSNIIWIFCAGLFWSYAVLTRLDSLITGLAAAWFLFVHANQEKIQIKIDIKKLAAFAIPWVLVLGVIVFYNYHRFGSILSTGYEDQPENIRFITPLLVGLQGFLFTPGRSLFLYSPPMIFAVLGIWPLWKKDRWLAGGLFLLISMYLIVMSKWQNWAGGYDWGPRHIYQITPFLAILAGAWMGSKKLFDRSAKRIGWAVLAILSVFIQILGLSADSVFIIKWFLSRMLQSFPPNSVDYVSPYIMQLPVYMPQFSSPALHWQWITNHGSDLLILKTLSENPAQTVFFAIPVIMIGLGGFVLWRQVRN